MLEWKADAAHKSATHEDKDKDVWLETIYHLHSFSTSCSPMIGQGHLAGQSKFISRNYLSLIDGGTTPKIIVYEKLNISLP